MTRALFSVLGDDAMGQLGAALAQGQTDPALVAADLAPDLVAVAQAAAGVAAIERMALAVCAGRLVLPHGHREPMAAEAEVGLDGRMASHRPLRAAFVSWIRPSPGRPPPRPGPRTRPSWA